MGGRLATGISSENAGLANYVVKRDWRRVLDREIRAEGYDFFYPKTGVAQGNQHLPTNTTNDPITLLAEARRPDSATFIIAGTRRSLYRFTAYEQPYYEGDNYFKAGEFESFYDWQLIGSGFSAQARRWEAVSCNGYLVLNNGVDLPVTYRVGDDAVEPIWELRDSGVASVGTIACLNDVLICGNISQVRPDKLDALLDGTLKNPQGFACQPYGAVQEALAMDTITYRVMWSSLDSPREFRATVKGSITAGSGELTLARPAKWIRPGTPVIILGAGVLGGNLISNVLLVHSNGLGVRLADFASTTVAGALVQNANQIGNIVAFDDLESDGKGIIKMLPIRDVLVIYKENAIFLCGYAGRTGQPFQFDRVYLGGDVPRYRNTLITVEGAYHLYASQNSFYRFDLVNRFPRHVEALQPCEATFFDRVANLDEDEVFAADNTATKEIFFCYTPTGADSALRLDYRAGTVSTTSAEYTAAIMVNRPHSPTERWFIMGSKSGAVLRYGFVDAPQIPGTGAQAARVVTVPALGIFLPEHVGRSIRWADGRVSPITAYISATQVQVEVSETIATKSFVIVGAIWHRAGSNYDSVIQSGMGSFGLPLMEKRMERYDLQLSSFSPEVVLKVDFLGGANAAESTVLATKTFAKAATQNMTTVSFMQLYLADRLTVSGRNNPCELTARIFSVLGSDSKSFSRRSE